MSLPVPQYDYPRKEASWCVRDALLFNLSIGVAPNNIELLHESSPAFQIFPTYATVLGHKGTNQDVVDFMSLQKPTDIDLPGVPSFDRSRVVDGEKCILIHRPLPPSSSGHQFHLEQKLSGIYDKGKLGTIIETTTRLVDTLSNVSYATVIGSVVAKGQGNWGGPKATQQVRHHIPDRTHDHSARCDIPWMAALLYRLNGDYNPLHIDPQAAHQAGFERPIVHGLYTWNTIAYKISQILFPGNYTALKQYQARFSAPVYPEDKLTIHIWRIGPSQRDEGEEARFVATNQNGITVLSNGIVVWRAQEESRL
ncbi:hypothetical protein AAEP93_005267 [Penicillium crustosum]